MPQIARLIGGAGTGKTTELLRTMTAAKDRLGGDIMSLGFASFTRAAREEAVDRASLAWGVSAADLSKEGWFRTIHSTVFRLLGLQPGQLVRMESKEDLEWLSGVFGVSVQVNVDEDTGRITYSGDANTSAALNCWELARATMQPLDRLARKFAQLDDNMPGAHEVEKIVRKYELAKRLEDRYDFSDTLLRFAGIRATPEGYGKVPPQGDLPGVQAWLFDEQQDASPLLDAVCRRLVFTPSVKWAYVVGDPFQSIFGFAGSSAQCFMSWEAQKERIMPKSYRCPKPILEMGERCLQLMRKGYFDRKIEPADHEGTVYESDGGIEELMTKVRPSEDWLLIARTNYQVQRMIGALTKNGIPFRSAKANAGPSVRSIGLKALCDLQAGRPISGSEWSRVLEVLPSRSVENEVLLKRGTKARWKEREGDWDVVFQRDLPDLGATDSLIEMIKSGRWPRLCDYGEQFVKSVQKHGLDITANPKIRLGTIHSVKGAEADNVAMLTTTTGRIDSAMHNDDTHDEEIRIAYVGITRARRHLMIVNDGPPHTCRMTYK